jgi:hypothetical protein
MENGGCSCTVLLKDGAMAVESSDSVSLVGDVLEEGGKFSCICSGILPAKVSSDLWADNSTKSGISRQSEKEVGIDLLKDRIWGIKRWGSDDQQVDGGYVDLTDGLFSAAKGTRASFSY